MASARLQDVWPCMGALVVLPPPRPRGPDHLIVKPFMLDDFDVGQEPRAVGYKGCRRGCGHASPGGTQSPDCPACNIHFLKVFCGWRDHTSPESKT